MAVVVILILLYAICSAAALHNPQSNRWLYTIFGIALILIAALRTEGIDRDYTEYISHLNNYADVALLEPTFKAIAWIVHTFCGGRAVWLFAIYAAIGVGLKFVAIRQISSVAMLSVALYISQFFILHEMTQIRAGVASAMVLLAIKPLYNCDWKRFLVIAAAATAFHLSGIVLFGLWFLNPKKRIKIYLFLIPIAVIFLLANIDILQLIPLPYLSAKIEIYKQIKEYTDSVHNTINPFNAIFLVRVALCYLLLWAVPTLKNHNRYFILLLKIFTLSLTALPIFATIPVVAYRIYELLGIVEIVLLPTLVYLFRPVALGYFVVIIYGFCQLMISIFYNRLIIIE